MPLLMMAAGGGQSPELSPKLSESKEIKLNRAASQAEAGVVRAVTVGAVAWTAVIPMVEVYLGGGIPRRRTKDSDVSKTEIFLPTVLHMDDSDDTVDGAANIDDDAYGGDQSDRHKIGFRHNFQGRRKSTREAAIETSERPGAENIVSRNTACRLLPALAREACTCYLDGLVRSICTSGNRELRANVGLGLVLLTGEVGGGQGIEVSPTDTCDGITH